MAEVAKHDTKVECRGVGDAQVHPSGELAILSCALKPGTEEVEMIHPSEDNSKSGKDATEEFNIIHPPEVIGKYVPDVLGKFVPDAIIDTNDDGCGVDNYDAADDRRCGDVGVPWAVVAKHDTKVEFMVVGDAHVHPSGELARSCCSLTSLPSAVHAIHPL